MANSCPSIIDFCRMRVTLLDAVGNVADTTDNSYVTDKTIQMQITPDVETGEERTLKGCGGCVIATSRQQDRLKRWQLEINLAALEPALLQLLLGVDIITDGGDDIGINGVSQTDCEFEPTLVAVEAWANTIVDDAPDPNHPYAYFVWPATFWQFGQNSIGQDFWQPTVAGFSRSNPLWGTGPYDDLGVAFSVDQWAIVQVAEAPPDAVCGYQHIAPGS